MLDVAETTGLEGLCRWLNDHGQGVIRGAGVGWVERPPDPVNAPIPREQGTGLGWTASTPAVLRGTDAAGRQRRRPSDRPPRRSDDARGVRAR